jgi:peptide-methionine (S)-S-oxide reductase
MKRRYLAASLVLAVALAAQARALAQDNAPTPAPDKPSGDAQAAAPDKAKPSAPKSSAKAKPRKTGSHSKARTSSPQDATSAQPKVEYATFGAGCFWHVEATFERLNGVMSAVSGYAGGHVRFPSYEMVHEGDTGHAEVVMVQYDPEIISYEDLLQVFWSHHDPTTPNQQGPDIGPQYRSIILYHNEAQRKAALKSYQDLVERRAFRKPIVTELVPLKAFYRAEDYHQDYYGGKPRAASRRHKTSVSKARKTQAKSKSTATPESASPAPTDDSPAPES